MQKEELIHSLREKFPEKIVSAFQKVKRENFLPDHLKSYAYEDMALPLEEGSTISQPKTISFMLELLELKQNQKILEIGSGSGYVLALLSEIIKNGKIYGMEIKKTLAINSKKLLEEDSNIEIFNRSGFDGLPEFAPFDRILISASCKDMRVPYNLTEQLKDKGILVGPVKESVFQIKKQNGKLKEKEFRGFAFVPLKE